MYHFRDQIRAGGPAAFFVLNGDVCADFPLKQLYDFHVERGPDALVSRFTIPTRSRRFVRYIFPFAGDDHEHGSHPTAVPQLWLHGYITSPRHSQSLRGEAEQLYIVGDQLRSIRVLHGDFPRHGRSIQ